MGEAVLVVVVVAAAAAVDAVVAIWATAPLAAVGAEPRTVRHLPKVGDANGPEVRSSGDLNSLRSTDQKPDFENWKKYHTHSSHRNASETISHPTWDVIEQDRPTIYKTPRDLNRVTCREICEP